MTSSSLPRRRARLAALAAVALTAGALTPLVGGSAAAQDAAPAPVGPPPAVPALVAPVDDVGLLKDVVLDWAAVPGATGYVVQVGTDEDWSGDPTLELPTVATRLTLPTSLPHASYLWRVAAKGAGGQSRWSAEGAFTRGWVDRPQRLTPTSGQTITGAQGVPTFSWTPVATASEYQLQVSTSPYFDAPFRTQSGVKTESCFTTRTTITPFNSQADARNDGAGECTFSLLGTGEQRYWRVRALDHVVDDAPEVDTTPVVDEGISSQPPAAAGELDTSACPAEPGTEETPVAEPTEPTEPTAPAAPTDGEEPAPAPTETAPPEEALGGCEPAHVVEKGRWSTSAGFTSQPWDAGTTVPVYTDLVTASSPMPTPTLSTDVCTGSTCADFPSISWGDVSNASWYRVYVALDEDFSNIHSIVETPGNTWTPTTQWRESTAGASYHVVVQPCTARRSTTGDQAPGCDEPSAPVLFRKKSPRSVLTSPDDGSLTNGGDVVLTWRAASEVLSEAIDGPATSEAYAYRLQVTTAANPDFHTAGLVEDVLVDTTHHVSPTLSYPDGDLLWRVQAVDASGHRLPWSSVRAFTRDTIAPTFTVSPTEGIDPDASVTVTFTEPVKNVASNTVRLRSTPSTITPVGDGKTFLLKANAMMYAGAPYTVEASPAITDLAGNSYVPVPVGLKTVSVVDDTSAGLRLLGTWARLGASGAVGGTYVRSLPTPTAWAATHTLVYGSGAELKGCVGPGNGIVEVWSGPTRLARVDTYRNSTSCGVVLARVGFPHGLHVVEVRGMGQKGAASEGTAMMIDAVTALP